MPWPRGVTNFAQYVHDYNVMLYENDDNYEDDAQDLHMFGIKVFPMMEKNERSVFAYFRGAFFSHVLLLETRRLHRVGVTVFQI